MPLTPIRALYRAVDLYGSKTGIVSGPCRFTYAEFAERCERLAFGLLDSGLAPAIAWRSSVSTPINFWKATSARR